jgi:hypothetical protein
MFNFNLLGNFLHIKFSALGSVSVHMCANNIKRSDIVCLGDYLKICEIACKEDMANSHWLQKVMN